MEVGATAAAAAETLVSVASAAPVAMGRVKIDASGCVEPAECARLHRAVSGAVAGEGTEGGFGQRAVAGAETEVGDEAGWEAAAEGETGAEAEVGDEAGWTAEGEAGAEWESATAGDGEGASQVSSSCLSNRSSTTLPTWTSTCPQHTHHSTIRVEVPGKKNSASLV